MLSSPLKVYNPLSSIRREERTEKLELYRVHILRTLDICTAHMVISMASPRTAMYNMYMCKSDDLYLATCAHEQKTHGLQ